jgi:uncharacterized membrane protein
MKIVGLIMRVESIVTSESKLRYLLYYKYVSSIIVYLLPLVIGVVATLMHKNMPIEDRCQENRVC